MIALPTVILAFFYGQSRIFFTVARDGFFPQRWRAVSAPWNAGPDHGLHRDRRRRFSPRLIPLDSHRGARQRRHIGGVRRSMCGNVGMPPPRAGPRAASSALLPAWLGRNLLAFSAACICSSACPAETQLFFLGGQVIGLILYAIYGEPRGRARPDRRCLRSATEDRSAASRASSAARPATSSNGTTGTLIRS